MNVRLISHAQLIDRTGVTAHELLSGHLRQLQVGKRVMLTPNGLRQLGVFGRQRGRVLDDRVFVVERVERRRIKRTVVELVVAHECQSHTLASRPMTGGVATPDR